MRGDSPDDPVQSIVFRNLHFSISNFGDEFVERRGTHGSTPWNEPANKDAAVYLENAHDCVVENCEVSDAGYSGIGIVWGGENNRIINNEIHDCGFHGVLLSGYRAEFGSTMDCNKENEIIGNTIHDCGKLVGHGSGIFIWASGENDVERNRISHMPRYGVCIKGQTADTIGEMSTHQWGGVYPQKVGDEVHGLETMTAENRYQFIHSNGNRIAFNDIAFCNEDTEDSGFVSLWGTGKNNVIENNVIHDGKRALGGIMIGIYLDDAVNDTRVDKNVIYGLQGGDVVYPIFAKGVFNVIEDNIVICEDKPGAAIASLAMGGEPTDHHSYRRNIIYLKGQPHVYDFMNWLQDRVIESDFNCFFPPRGEYSFAGAPGDWTKLDGGKFDSHSIFSDPLFMDLDKRDFRLKPDSPALKLGFEQPAPLNAP